MKKRLDHTARIAVRLVAQAADDAGSGPGIVYTLALAITLPALLIRVLTLTTRIARPITRPVGRAWRRLASAATAERQAWRETIQMIKWAFGPERTSPYAC